MPQGPTERALLVGDSLMIGEYIGSSRFVVASIATPDSLEMQACFRTVDRLSGVYNVLFRPGGADGALRYGELICWVEKRDYKRFRRSLAVDMEFLRRRDAREASKKEKKGR